MAKKARRYDIYLPIAFNDGRAIPDDRFDQIERRLFWPDSVEQRHSSAPFHCAASGKGQLNSSSIKSL